MSPRARRIVETAITTAVLAVAAASATAMWAESTGRGDGLWRGFYHDRHGHFGFALDLALALRSLDPIGFLSELEKAKVWPPAHGLILSVVLLLGGLDHRLGVVPSLAGWALTVVCVWLIARRLFADMPSSVLTGIVAVSLTAVSPAFRSIASDVMLEGLGAALSALALLMFMRAWGHSDSRAWRPFAVTLTVLFFEKGNYWALIAVSALVTWFVNDRERAVAIARRLRPFAMRRHLWRDPLILIAIALIAGTLVVVMRGPTAFVIAGQRVSLYPPRNLLTIAYWLLFVRAFLVWRKNRDAIDDALGVPGRTLCGWHAIPVAVSFLLPQRLATFLWFISPLNAPHPRFDLAGGVTTYWSAFESFHAAPWVGVVVIALFAVAVARLRALPPEGRLVVVFGLVSTAAVVVHPARSDRYLTTVMLAYWIGAAAGIGLLAGGPFAGSRLWRLGGAALPSAALVVWMLFAHPAAPASRLDSAGPSDLELVSAYAPFVDGRRSIGIAATIGNSRLLDWPLLERCRCQIDVDTFAPMADSRDAVRALGAVWLTHSRADRIVVLDLPQSAVSLPALGWTYDRMAGIVDAAAQSERFTQVAMVSVPAFGGRILILDRR